MFKKTKKEQRNIAKDLFVTTGMSCKEISETLGISEQSLVRWRREGKWDAERTMVKTSPDILKGKVREALIAISEGKPSEVDADALLKTFKVYQHFDGRVSLGVVVSIFKEFDRWLAEVAPEKWIEIKELQKQFIQYRAELDSQK